jgi:hypothetical protein
MADIPNPPGTTSAGTVASNAATAQDQGANTVNPNSTATSDTTPSNAVPAVTANTAVGSAPPKLDAAGQTATNQLQTPADTYGTPSNLPVTPGSGTVSALQSPSSSGATQNYIYKATMVTSKLSQGKFTQELDGVLLIFPTGSATTGNVQQTGASTTASQNSPDAVRESAVNTASSATSPVANFSTAPGATRTPTNVLGTQGQAPQSYGVGFQAVDINNIIATSSGTYGGGGGSTSEAQALTQPVGIATNSIPTSGGQTVAIASPQLTGPVDIVAPQVSITTNAGETIVVSTAQQVQALYSQGLISVTERDRAITSISSLIAAQQSVASIAVQNIRRDV